MRVLGIDTATWTTAVGVTDGDTVVAERAVDTDRRHAGNLPALVSAVLREAGLRMRELAGVAVSAGPGSFTGLRVGAAFAKGLAYAGDLPLIGVPTLEAHATSADAPSGTRVCVANDARRGEVYAGVFRVTASGEVAVERAARAWRPAELEPTLPDGTLVVGDGGALLAMAAPGRLTIWPVARCRPRGGAVAVLGARRLAAGERAPVGTFEPTYVREPDATLPSRPLH